MNFVSYGPEYGAASDQNDQDSHLRFELGWTEVRRGLGLILRGYVLLICFCIIVGVAVGVLIGMSPAERAKIPWQVRDIGLFLGLGAFGLLSLYCYGCIIVGHWRCLMNAPERRGAKWLMFACLTCILAGPALNFAAGVTGIQQQPKMKRGIEDLKDIQYSAEGAIMQIGSVGIAVLGNVLFILFLRAVARCFEDKVRVLLVDLYLVFTALLVVGTFCLAFALRDKTLLMQLGILIVLGWVCSFLGYLVIIGIIKGGISSGLRKLGPAVSPIAGTRA